MITQSTDITPLQSLFLMVIKSSDGSVSGAEIVRTIRSQLGNQWVPTPGARYKVLKNLLEKGLIEETTQKEERDDQRVRTYSLTDAGLQKVKEVMEQATHVFKFMSSCCSEYCEPCTYCC